MRAIRRLLLTLLILILAGCQLAPLNSRAEPSASGPTARGRSARSPAPIEASQPVSISWSFWGDPWEVEVNRRVARAFEAEHPSIKVEHPSIKVELRHRPWSEYFTWLESTWQQGEPPDVMFLNYIPARAPSGQLEPLNAYFLRDGFDLSDFYPRLLDQFQVQGIYYGLPRDNDTKVIYYSKTIFELGGLAPPSKDWTWSDLRLLASKLTERDATGRALQYGFAFEAETWWVLFVWQNGGDLTDDPFNPRRLRLDEPAAVEAIQFLADLVHHDRSTPPADVLLDTEKIMSLFREGRLAMALGNHAVVPSLVEAPGLQWDIANLPAGRERANLAGGAGYALSARSVHKEAAWALLRFLEGPKGQALFAESGLIVPARRSIREDNIFLRQQPYSTQVWSGATEYGRPFLNADGREAIVNAVEPALASVWRGERTAAEAIEAVAPALRALIER